MSGSMANIDITGPVAVRTAQHTDSETIGMFFTDENAPTTFMQMFGSEENLRAFAESILTALTTHTASRPTGEPS